MLGFHADGIRLFGASDTLVAALKKHKLPLVKTSTTNTLVFAVNTAEPLTKSFICPLFWHHRHLGSAALWEMQNVRRSIRCILQQRRIWWISFCPCIIARRGFCI